MILLYKEVSIQARSPAGERNKQPTLDVLNPHLPPQAWVSEVASGTGQHAQYFCMKRPDIVWQPSDSDRASIASIESYRGKQSRTGLNKLEQWSVLESLPEHLNRPFA